MNIVIFLIGLYIGVELGHHFLYSDKARVKKMWKEIFELTKKRKEMQSPNDSVQNYIVLKPFDVAISKRKNLINAILENCFNPEEDSEYIKKNRPQNID